MTKDRQVELPSHLTLVIWELVAAVALALIYGPYSMHTAAGYKLYIICRKWVWGLCLAWVTFACVKEVHTFIKHQLTYLFFMKS